MNDNATPPQPHGSSSSAVSLDNGHVHGTGGLPERFENPGLPPHQPRHADIDPAAAKRAERQVLALLSRGWDNARIGRDLFISQHTVRTHIQNILEKLGMHSKLEAATFAMQRSTELELTPDGAGLDH